ncbi:MAG: hypothetical protein KDA87_23870 [Planctomycetales bacterium]|nr:hypothetical protein [Planctomycetales bacterium]
MSQAQIRTETTRVDTAHGLEPQMGIRLDDEPTRELLASIAGLDSGRQAEQFHGHAQELAALLQERLAVLDQRESELNARLAVVEREERTVRLRSLPGFEFSNDDANSLDSRDQASDHRPHSNTPEPPDTSERGTDIRSHKEVRVLANELAMPKASPSHSASEGSEPKSQNDRAPQHISTEPWDAEEHQRQSELAKRERQLEKLHDEITMLHREALSMRIATEQTWAQMAGVGSDQDVASSMRRLRQSLDDNYRLANDELQRRRTEMAAYSQRLAEQEARLRTQVRDAQLWIDRRWNELESRDAQLLVRENAIDHREADFERQSLEWQRQREEYRDEIEQLSRRIRLQHAAECA